jgi:hypothetical protein
MECKFYFAAPQKCCSQQSDAVPSVFGPGPTPTRRHCYSTVCRQHLRAKAATGKIWLFDCGPKLRLRAMKENRVIMYVLQHLRVWKTAEYDKYVIVRFFLQTYDVQKRSQWLQVLPLIYCTRNGWYNIWNKNCWTMNYVVDDTSQDVTNLVASSFDKALFELGVPVGRNIPSGGRKGQSVSNSPTHWPSMSLAQTIVL